MDRYTAKQRMQSSHGMILQADRLTKRYSEAPVLDNVSFRIEQGSVMALCGASGAGKTTLVRILGGLLGFDGGAVTLGGRTIQSDEPYPKSLFGQIGVVFQEHNLFPHLTAMQNVCLALRSVRKMTPHEATQRAEIELDRMGLRHRAQAYPARLSGGERQRVAIARALAMDPLMLILDEPTSGLDPSRIAEVHRIISGLSDKGTTMLLITHNIRLAKSIGSRFALLERGHLNVSSDPSILTRMEEDWD